MKHVNLVPNVYAKLQKKFRQPKVCKKNFFSQKVDVLGRTRLRGAFTSKQGAI